ncbi:NAGLU [Acanthosepion pharaonis]|uniref:NAGLU n=1 Tax=Acanthosepion pharaonis TaxID=158019 RepID=A0A812DSK6_ACAPH|nr:NAGLU [Sepia pharaonis]
MKLLLYFLIITLVGRNEGNNHFPHFRKLKSRATASVQTAAAQDVVRRLIPDRAEEFNIQVDPQLAEGDKDVFTLVTDKVTGKINITGNAGVVATWGFYHFLKFHCGCHVSWGGQQLNIPKPLPVIEAPGHRMVSNDQFRYYENVCTVSYSFVWYNWTDWERQIDWMALNGINLPLAFNGQEAIMQRVFTNMNFTQKDLDDFFTGPAFLAWFRMGNIQKWGGPLPQSWINDQLVLQHRILRRMRSLGMIPVLAGFGGHVPANIKKLYPNVNVSTLTNWSQFKPPYSGTTIINFDDPLFAEVGRRFIEETIKELGTNHVYATDLFNEMRPKSSNITYLKMSGAAIYKGMVSADPDAVWVMQGWLFQDSSFWKLPQAKALLTSVPMGRMIVLDLFAEIRPLWQKYDSFFGQPFVWCMLHNYGGTMDLYGDIESVNVGPSTARSYPNSSMIGIGISPEGINQNYVMYEFMLDQGIGPGPKNIAEWISGYAKRRYGVENRYIDIGWQLLRGTVYSCNKTIHDAHGNVVFTGRPHLNMKEAVSFVTNHF